MTVRINSASGNALDLNLIYILSPGLFGWLLITLCYSCVAFLLAIGTTDNHSGPWLWMFLGPPALFALISANEARYCLLMCQLLLRTPVDEAKLINAFAQVAAVMLIPAWVLTLGAAGNFADAFWAGLIWSLLVIGLALMQQYLFGIIPLLLFALLIRFGLKALGVELHLWDLIFSLPRWMWLIFACASCVAGWQIDRNRTQKLLTLNRTENALALAEMPNAAPDLAVSGAVQPPGVDQSQSAVEDTDEYFEALQNAAIRQPGTAVVAMLLGEPSKASKSWAMGLALAGLVFAYLFTTFNARVELHSLAIGALGLVALALSANSISTLDGLSSGVAQHLSMVLAPTMLRDRQLRRHLVGRVLNDALALLQTTLPLIIAALVALMLPAPKPLLSWITAGAVVLGFAGFAAIYPALVALIYMRYRFIEAGLWLTAMLTSSALVIMVLMLFGRWSATPIWLGFVLCALIVCIDCIRFRPIRLVHFLRDGQLRRSRFDD